MELFDESNNYEETVTTMLYPESSNMINSTFLANDSDERGTPSPELFDGYSTAILTFAWISCIIFIILGVPGNLITIAALAKCKKVRNATAVFIINLSLSDLLFCCFNLPLATSTFMNKAWTHGDLLCRLFPLLRYGLVAVSLFTILAITINRYVMIGHPRIYPKIYQRKFLIVMVVGCWLFAFLPLIFTWSGHWGTFGLDISIGSCSILPDKKGHSPKEFLFIIAFALPCLCIIICYARIFYIVRKTHESVIKSVGSIKIVHANSNMKITSNAPLAEEEKLCYDEKKRQNDGISDENVDAEKQLIPKNNNATESRRTIMKKNNNNNHHHEQHQKNHKIHRDQYSGSAGSDSVAEASGGGIGGNASNISGGSYNSCASSSASNNENNIFCKNNNNTSDNGNESERTMDSVAVAIASSRTSSLYNRQRKFLTKLDQDEDLKFIDTSIESDLPPTLSNLRQNNSNASARKLSAQLSVRINEMNNFVINGATTTTTVDLHDDDDDKVTNEFDSAMEYSSSSTTNNSSLATEQIYREIKDANKLSNSTQYLAVQIEPSSSSGIDIPYDQEANNVIKTPCVAKKRSFVQTLRKSTRLAHRKRSMGNTSGASMMYPGRMTAKDRRLLKMILVIFVSFVICYLPITINKTFDSIAQNHFMNITGYLLIYLTTCINPIIYVVMSSEYRQAYKNLLMCRNGNVRQGKNEIQRNASPRA